MKYDSDYEVRLATLGAMGGDVTKHFDSVYEIDLEILDIVQHGGGGGGGAVINDSSISTSTTWSSSKIVSELANAGFDVEIVTELPSTGDAHTIYFIASSSSQTGNVYDEYMYINGNWEQVGSTAIDLSNYYTKSEIDTSINNALAPYATIANVDASLANKANSSDLANYATITDVDASLALKANASDLASYATIADVDASLALKANVSDLTSYATIVNVDASLANYATIANVDASLANKANNSDLASYATITDVDASLSLKANVSDLDSYATIANVDASLALKQDTLTAGTNITIQNNVISATGGGSGADVVELTQDEYDALSTADKNNGKIYSITDTVIVTPMTKAQADTYYNPINNVTSGNGIPSWNSRGQITSAYMNVNVATLNINGTDTTYPKISGLSGGDRKTIYGPTTAGTAGYYLVSSGSGAPVWQELEVASDFVIADADASAGTYSTDIATFYTKTMEENIMQGVQIKIVDSHNVSTYAVDSSNPIGILSDGDLFVVADGDTATIVVNNGSDHTVSIAADGTITDADSTGAVASSNVVRVDGGYLFEFDGNSTYTWVSITSDGAYAVTTGTGTVTSDSYYLPSSSRIYGNNIELWLMYTEDGVTWQNIHYLIDGSSISRTVTNGQFGPVNA